MSLFVKEEERKWISGFKARNAVRTITDIVNLAGNRFVGTEGDRRAREYVIRSFRELGLDVRETIGAQLLGVSNSMGSDMFMIALIIIIVGGVGSVQGALLGAMIIGLVDAFGKAYFPALSMFSMYLTMIVILLVRPQGLLGRKV
jgi:hypothetical protein